MLSFLDPLHFNRRMLLVLIQFSHLDLAGLTEQAQN